MANTLAGKVNILAFKDAKKLVIDGEKGVFLPLNETMYVGEKGVYVPVRIVPCEKEFNGKKSTHFIALAVESKETRDELIKFHGEDYVKALTPIIGNLTEYAKQNGMSVAEFKEAVNVEKMPDLPF